MRGKLAPPELPALPLQPAADQPWHPSLMAVNAQLAGALPEPADWGQPSERRRRRLLPTAHAALFSGRYGVASHQPVQETRQSQNRDGLGLHVVTRLLLIHMPPYVLVTRMLCIAGGVLSKQRVMRSNGRIYSSYWPAGTRLCLSLTTTALSAAFTLKIQPLRAGCKIFTANKANNHMRVHQDSLNCFPCNNYKHVNTGLFRLLL